MRSTLRIALAALLRNRLQTGLTMLGVGIGVAAVICTAALGAAGADRVQAQIDALGEDFLWVRAGSRNIGGVRTGSGGARTLTADDAAALAEAVPGITACSPMLAGREQLVTGGRNWNTRYQGVRPEFFEIRRRTLEAGTYFTDADEADATRVLVLGRGTARELFGDENPIGQTVRMNRFPFRVIGVLAARGMERGGVDRDDVVFVPYETARRSLDRRDWVGDVMCSVADPELLPYAEADAAAVLRERHGLRDDDPDDFQIQRPLEALEMRASAARTMTLTLTAIGTVSLIVGGVGIMNIMLVSVSERTREIGIRLAVGARVRDIRSQFLLEAMGIGLAGGALGVAAGFLGAWGISHGFGWPALVTRDAVIIAGLSSLLTGALFGYLPAHQASTLDPIHAIRHDE